MKKLFISIATASVVCAAAAVILNRQDRGVTQPPQPSLELSDPTPKPSRSAASVSPETQKPDSEVTPSAPVTGSMDSKPNGEGSQLNSQISLARPKVEGLPGTPSVPRIPTSNQAAQNPSQPRFPLPTRPSIAQAPRGLISSSNSSFSNVPNPVSAAAVENFTVPIGAILPAALVDSGDGASPAQATALDQIAEDFLNEIPATEEPGRATVPSRAKNSPIGRAGWDAAAQNSNERYRLLFGVEAQNAWSKAAAKEALADRR